MRRIVLFVEDYGHEAFIQTLVNRLARENGIKVKIEPRCVRGGHGKVITEYQSYLLDLQREKDRLPDLLIVATDANCKGYVYRRREIEDINKEFKDFTIYAIPDPHIEHWLLLDSAAFKSVLGRGCDAPPGQKCLKNHYKKLLLEAVRNAGVNPLLGGVEFTEDIVNAMNWQHIEDKSFGRFFKELQNKFKEWSKS